MTKEEQLKAIILSKHKSVSAFAEAVEIPYTTVISILKRGIDTAGNGYFDTKKRNRYSWHPGCNQNF